MEDDVEGGADTNGPIITSVEPLNQTTVIVLFSEAVSILTAENISNYSISNNATVSNAARHPFQSNKVTLTVENMFTGANTLTISNVEDMLGNPINTSNFNFNYLAITAEEISKIKMYPNPNTGVFNIDGLELNEFVEIKNSLGQTIKSFRVEGKILKIDLNLESGLYLIKTEQKLLRFIVSN